MSSGAPGGDRTHCLHVGNVTSYQFDLERGWAAKSAFTDTAICPVTHPESRPANQRTHPFEGYMLLGVSGLYLAVPHWSRDWDSNPGPPPYQGDALPTELSRLVCQAGIEPTTFRLEGERSTNVSY